MAEAAPIATTVEYRRPDGKTCAGYLVEPARAAVGTPALVLLEEWWGLNAQIRGMAERFAAAGIRTLVPDLFRGRLAKDRAEASHMMSHLDFGDAASQDVRGALQYLKERSARVAVAGFCMGGALTLLAAASLRELDAAVCFYGIPPAEVFEPSQIRVPLQCHFAEHDDWCTPELVSSLEQRLVNGGVAHEIHRYDAAHAFMNAEQTKAYSEPHARLAWERAITFLHKHLGSRS
ncbi:MAG TPA: dienelactone hydrolase family protein [Polyangiaceae bacterium]|nr:dienelactone hydrolase family protein [Polyangiaceae bacterium]